MDSTTEQHIRRLDAQIQALKSQLVISEKVISELIFRLQVLEGSQFDITDPDYVRIEGSISALETIRPLKQRADV